MENEDKNKVEETTAPSAEILEEEEETVIETEETESKDIDFKKKAEELESIHKPKRSKLEEARFNLKKNAERLKELGGDPSEILETPKVESEIETDYVTKNDLARLEARQLVKSDDEMRVVMWYVENKGLSVDDAYFLANKGKIKNANEEMKRIVKPPVGSGGTAGQKPKVSNAPELPKQEAMILTRRGYKLVKPGLYQAKYNQKRYDEKLKIWIDEKISK